MSDIGGDDIDMNDDVVASTWWVVDGASWVTGGEPGCDAQPFSRAEADRVRRKGGRS